MRFFVGEKIPVIRINRKETKTRLFQNYWNLYQESRDDFREGKLAEFLDIDIRMLQVTEHHKVPNHWGDKEDLCSDGFLLKDVEGKEWRNQYPTASYGQMDDSNDWRFWFHDPNSHGRLAAMNSAALFIEGQYEQLRRMEKDKDSDQEFYNFLKQLQELVEKKLLEDFGLVVKIEQPWADEGLTDIYDAVFIQSGTNLPLNTPA